MSPSTLGKSTQSHTNKQGKKKGAKMNRAFLLSIVIAGLYLPSLPGFAEDISDTELVESVTEYAQSPELHADLVVVFVPDHNIHLNVRSSSERRIEGKIHRHEKGYKSPQSIIQKAHSIIAPLHGGVPVKLYLREYPNRPGIYYPIAIFPYTDGAEK